MKRCTTRPPWLSTGMACLVVGAVCAALGGCAGLAPVSRVAAPAHLLADGLFKPQPTPIDVAAVFALSPAMRQYLHSEIEPLARRVGAPRALFDALYAKGQLRLEYDTSTTRNAAEAFESRSGNCLSLLIMTGAFARELGLEVHYQSVLSEAAWDRREDLHFYIGHVNLRLGGSTLHRAFTGSAVETLTIDFLPGQDIGRQRVQAIDEARVLAMYMNNRAAESLVRGQLDEAYAWLREALRQDPQFMASYNTLGVTYLRRGATREAEAVLRHALAGEPESTHVLGNLALTLQRQGREAEAEVLLAEQRRLQPVPPFAWFREGLQAMRDAQYERARRLFEREIARMPDYHEFHYWLAQAHLHLGGVRDARRHLEQALENSTTRAQHDIYAAKLQRLNAAAKL